jgi:membrane-bound lytic murein transglycosylase D
MKTTLWKQVVLCFILITYMQYMHAGDVYSNESLLKNDSNNALNFSNTSSSIPLQASVQTFSDAYITEHAVLLTSIKERNSKTFKLIRKILVKRGVPAELVYLAVVESKLKSTATSGAGAAGVWQLMPVTARTLGLKVDGLRDERRNIYQSSAAAAQYLNTLYKQFDDWLLVIAAYNCGAGNVYKAIKLSGSREFWKMQRYLPKETRDHVKRFIATHFFLEGNGSLATLTKKERANYLQSENEKIVTIAENNKTAAANTGVIPMRWVLVVKQEETEWLLELRF